MLIVVFVFVYFGYGELFMFFGVMFFFFSYGLFICWWGSVFVVIVVYVMFDVV